MKSNTQRLKATATKPNYHANANPVDANTEPSLDECLANMRANLAIAKLRLKRLRKERMLQRLHDEIDAVEATIEDESRTVSLEDVFVEPVAPVSAVAHGNFDDNRDEEYW